VFLLTASEMGASMLALPIVAHGMGMALAAVAMIALWALMTYTGLMMLEVCLAFPPGTEFGQIGRTLFGPRGGAAVNGVALAMLYAFSASFISAAGSTYGADLSAYLGWHMPAWAVSVGYVLVIAVVVFSGGRRAAAANRVFFAINLTLLAALVVSVAPSVHLDNLYRSGPELAWMLGALPVFMTAYSYHTTVPTMLSYAGTSSPRSLRLVFIVANLIALVTYVVWIFVALGSLPLKGPHSFAQVERSGQSVGVFLHEIDAVGHNAATPNLFHAFSSTILVTTYLATALALQDVLRGALRSRQSLRAARLSPLAKRAALTVLCFGPPLAVGLTFQGAFVQLLSFSSIFAASLSILFPVAALHRLRCEGARRAGLKLPSYRVFVFWGMYVLVFECGALIVVFQVFTMLGALKS
jgi:tyrosine-specific transport protein